MEVYKFHFQLLTLGINITLLTTAMGKMAGYIVLLKFYRATGLEE